MTTKEFTALRELWIWARITDEQFIEFAAVHGDKAVAHANRLIQLDKVTL